MLPPAHIQEPRGLKAQLRFQQLVELSMRRQLEAHFGMPERLHNKTLSSMGSGVSYVFLYQLTLYGDIQLCVSCDHGKGVAAYLCGASGAMSDLHISLVPLQAANGPPPPKHLQSIHA